MIISTLRLSFHQSFLFGRLCHSKMLIGACIFWSLNGHKFCANNNWTTWHFIFIISNNDVCLGSDSRAYFGFSSQKGQNQTFWISAMKKYLNLFSFCSFFSSKEQYENHWGSKLLPFSRYWWELLQVEMRNFTGGTLCDVRANNFNCTQCWEITN